MNFNDVHRWIKRGDVVRLREALTNGLDPSLSNKYGWTFLMLAALTGNAVVGALLIEHGAAVDSRNKLNDTALSLAIQSGHPSFVDLLVRNGASKDCHPHGNSLAVFLEWAEEHCPCSPSNMRKIRKTLKCPDSPNTKMIADESQ